ncbi:NAD-dependent protein deacylase [Candida viswanathii]|uniref:NAD-dependent protein deacylase n=1 Tax=Candida viswanathii TaxID=5486 RepID=A0A367XSW8_9ASCO|nr:NAD-dependent protein deacylase [Candida viswanathii]
MDEKQLKEFQECLKQSKKIIALVGAGLSVSSGLPIIHGTQELYKNYNSIDLSTPDSFYIDPSLVWQYYSYKRHQALQAKPNKGHVALSKLSRLDDVEYITITQNNDGLHGQSGHDDDKLFEIHGSLFDLKCTSFMCNFVDHNNFTHPLTKALEGSENEYVQGTRKRKNEEKEAAAAAVSLSPQFTPVKSIPEKDLPLCPICKELLRPGVVWFGEPLSLNLISKIDNFIEGKDPVIDLILVIGTSGTVYPANSFIERVKLKGGKIAIFNIDIDEDIVSGKQPGVWGFKGDAAELLPIALKPLIGDI